jgi:peptidyl-prolyl cis-trans isomerase SurA
LFPHSFCSRFAPQFAATTLAVGLALAPAAPAAAAEKLVEGIAAQVGAEIVLASEVFEMSGPIEKRMRAAGAPEQEILALRRDALERLIETKLLSTVVDRLELNADREEIDAAVEAIASENDLTIEQLLRSVTSHGLTLDEYRGKIRGEIERGKVLNAMVRSRVKVEAEDVEALFQDRFGNQPEGGEEVYVRHLVVVPKGRSATTSGQACQLVSEARAEITSGTSEFAALAQRYSDMNADRGGDLGWIHRKDLAEWMSDRVDTMKPGELSPVIEMPFGCNLLQLVDRREFEPVTFEQAAPQLQNFIFNQKTEVEYTEWLDVLRAQTYIDRKGAFGG